MSDVPKTDGELILRLQRDLAAAQAKIDALMLEYCPDMMTDEQWLNWEHNQQPVDAETEKAADDAARRKP
jgi:hypothetical protein